MTRIKTIAASALLAAGINVLPAGAQQTGTTSGTASGTVAGQGGHLGGGMLGRAGAALDLTDAQKATAKQLFADSRQQSEPIVTQLRQVRTDMQAAVKANNTAQIATLAARQGQLEGQLAEIRAQGMAAFYAQLTPEQKAKADDLHQKMGDRAAARQQRGQNWRQNHPNNTNNQQ